MRRRFIKNILKIVYIKNNEIWYTNGSNITPTPPHSPDAFNTSIISTVYSAKVKNWVITFDNDVTSIGSEAFAFCTGLTSITIPDSVTSIGYNAFYYCDSLTSITIPDSVTSIGYDAFYGCSSLTSITIPDGVTAIGGSAFAYCSSLTSITIPDSVVSIGDSAFGRCSSMKEVYCKATTPPTLGNAFVFGYNASNRKIYVPYQSLNAYKTAQYWSKYAADIVGYDFENDTIV